jgi:hypothetical protein
VTCGNAGQPGSKMRPIWTSGAPGVLVCSGIVRAAVRGGVLPRTASSGSWRWGRVRGPMATPVCGLADVSARVRPVGRRGRDRPRMGRRAVR